MPITYQVWIDKNRNGIQTSGDVITNDIIDLTWRLGMAQPYDTMAPPGWAEIVLDARSGAYTGANAAALMGCCITILSDDGTTSRTHFVGFIDTITPAAGSYGPQTALLRAQTRDAALVHHTPAASLSALSEANALVRSALVGSGMPYRVTVGYALLNDASAVVGTAKLFDEVESYSGHNGLTSLAYGGVWNSSSTPNAQAYIGHVMAAERGRFYCGRDGTLTLLNRHDILKTLTSQLTLANDMTELVVSSGQDIVNDIEIPVLPRRLGSPNSLLWSLSAPLQLAPGQPRRLQITFRDDVTRLIGALIITSYTLSASQNGSDVTSFVSSWLSDITLNGAVLNITHPYNKTVSLAALNLYGTPLFCDLPQTSHLVDMTSVTAYGRHHRSLTLLALSTLEQADDIALYEISHLKTPRVQALSVTLTTQSHPSHVLTRTLYERITVSETQSLPVGDYLICAETHHVAWGLSHQVTWLLEPVDDAIFLCVGGLLDGVHVIAY